MTRRDDLLGISGGDTVIGPDVKVKGNLVSEGDIVIDGNLNGLIKAAGSVTVGVNATILANITARSVKIAGSVTGDIATEGETAIASTGRVKGNITSGTLEIAPGAIFVGASSMSEPPAVSPPEANADDAAPV
jgi:cytoskeletal protein CcmA (bactofilin family)